MHFNPVVDTERATPLQLRANSISLWLQESSKSVVQDLTQGILRCVCVCVCVVCSMCASTWSNTQSLSRDPDGARGPPSPTKSVSWFSGWNQEKGAASSGGRSTRSAVDKEEEISKSGHRHFDDETYRNETVYKKASRAGVTESL